MAFAWLALRPLRTLVGRNDTLASESELARGVIWRWAVAALATLAARVGRSAGDTRFPEPLAFEQRRQIHAERHTGHSPDLSKTGDMFERMAAWVGRHIRVNG